MKIEVSTLREYYSCNITEVNRSLGCNKTKKYFPLHCKKKLPSDPKIAIPAAQL